MNPDRQETRVKDAMRSALALMGLTGRYDVRLIFDWGHEGDCETDEDNATRVHLTTCVTNASWQYSMARLRWYMPQVCVLDDVTLLATAVHECVHIVLNPIDSLLEATTEAGKANEFVTENVTRCLLRAADITYPGSPDGE